MLKLPCIFDSLMFILILPGNTERQVLENIETIVADSLPLESVQSYYSQFGESSRNVVLKYISFYESQKLVSSYD